jgi:hypothetical protein
LEDRWRDWLLDNLYKTRNEEWTEDEEQQNNTSKLRLH